jgi:4-amino-4-deoxy-L-arabinose transferase-like glycosyltransferase
MSETRSFNRWKKHLTPTRLLAIILTAGVLLRLAVALVMGDRVEILPGIFDQLSYDRLAQNVLAGNGFSFDQDWWPLTRAGEPTAHWSYAMTLYLVGVYGALGQHPLAARLIQAIIAGILMPWLIYRLSKRTFRTREEMEGGKRTWSFGEAVAVLAAAWTAFYGYFIYYAAALMTETFYITCILWTLDCAQRTAQAQAGENKARTRLYLELGLAAGLAVLFRQAFMLFLPFLFAWLWWASARGKSRVRVVGSKPGLRSAWLPGKGLVARSLASLAMVVLLILPFTVFNYTRFQRFVLLNTNSGYAFFWANHPIHGSKFIPLFTEEMPSYQELIPEELHGLDEAALDQALLKLGFGYVLSDPKRYLLLSLSRIPEHFIFWPLATSPLLSNLTRVGSLGVALPFSLAGLALWANDLRRKRLRDLESGALLILFLIVYSGLHILTWAGIRYRLPVDPVLVLFATYGFGKIITWAMERFRKQPASQ